MKYLNSLFTLLLLPVLAAPALAQSADQSVKIVKGVVNKVESVEMESADNSGGDAVVGGVIGYNPGSGRSQSQKRRSAVVGTVAGAAAGAPEEKLGVRYTVTSADGSSVAVISGYAPSSKPGLV